MSRLIEVRLDQLDDGTNVRSAARRRKGARADYGLIASIREHGVLQAITVVGRGKRFEVLYGHRRTTAARAAGLTTIPAIVEVEPPDKPLRQLVENEHRRRVDPVGIARALRAHLDGHPGTSQEELARKVGRPGSWVSRHLTLLDLDVDTQDRIAAGGMGMDRALREHNLTAARKPVGRPRILALPVEEGHSASVAVLLTTDIRPDGQRSHAPVGAGKATIGIERGTPRVELVIEDATGHGVMLSVDVASAQLLGRRLAQAASAASGSAPRAPGSTQQAVQVSSGRRRELRLPRPALPESAEAERTA